MYQIQFYFKKSGQNELWLDIHRRELRSYVTSVKYVTQKMAFLSSSHLIYLYVTLVEIPSPKII